METKKYDDKKIERRIPLHFMIGLNIALGLTLVAFEWKAEEGIISIDEGIITEQVWEPTIVLPPPPAPIKPKPLKVPKIKETIEEPVEIKEEVLIDQDATPEPYIVPILPNLPKEPEIDEPFIIVEEMPSFPGGWNEFYRFVSTELKYPKKAIRMNAEGKVYVEFIVEKDGSITDLKIAKGIGFGCDEETLRVMKLLPKFNPGKQRGIPVRVKKMLPINFRLRN